MATAIEIIEGAAALQNDAAQTEYNFESLVPYLNIAVDEMQEELELNNIPITNETSATIAVPINTLSISRISTPAYPSNLIEIQKILERRSGSSDRFIELDKAEFLPIGVQQVNELLIWSWINQEIRFIGALTAREIRLNYIKSLVPVIDGPEDEIDIINCKSFLKYKTAALASRFIGENPTRADELDAFAVIALSRMLTINVKGKQFMAVRRRPFMSRYKSRSII